MNGEWNWLENVKQECFWLVSSIFSLRIEFVSSEHHESNLSIPISGARTPMIQPSLYIFCHFFLLVVLKLQTLHYILTPVVQLSWAEIWQHWLWHVLFLLRQTISNSKTKCNFQPWWIPTSSLHTYGMQVTVQNCKQTES